MVIRDNSFQAKTNIEVVILVGGLGKRLAEVVPDTPKPLAPIQGQPFLKYLLAELEQQGVDRVVLAAGHRSEHIQKFCSSNSFKFQLDTSIEDAPLGTGGALRKAFQICKQKTVIALNGDTYFPVPLKKLIQFHEGHHFTASLALKRIEDISRYGIVHLDGVQIIGFSEKAMDSGAPEDGGLINGGVTAFDRDVFLAQTSDQPFSLEKDFFEISGAKNSKATLGGIEFDVPFLDIGIPADYQLAQKVIPEWASSAKNKVSP